MVTVIESPLTISTSIEIGSVVLGAVLQLELADEGVQVHADVIVTPFGKLSAIVAPVTSSGPLLVTTIVYVPVPPGV